PAEPGAAADGRRLVGSWKFAAHRAAGRLLLRCIVRGVNGYLRRSSTSSDLHGHGGRPWGEDGTTKEHEKTRNGRPGSDLSADILGSFFVPFRVFRGHRLAFAAVTVASMVGQTIAVNPGRSWAVVSDLPD